MAAAKSTAPKVADKPTGPSKASTGSTFIYLHRGLVGWGNEGDILEVADVHNEDVQGLLANEHATIVPKKDLVPDPDVAEQVVG